MKSESLSQANGRGSGFSSGDEGSGLTENLARSQATGELEGFLATMQAMQGQHGELQVASIDPSGAGALKTHIVQDTASAAAWAQAENGAGRNLYYQPNPVRPGLSSKAQKSDIAQALFCQVDIDPPKDGSPFDVEAVKARLQALSCPPTMIIASGNGVQALWAFQEAPHQPEDVEAISRGIAAQLGGDKCHAINHLMRLPGTINHPNAAKRAAGRAQAPATLLQGDNGRTYSLEQLGQAFPRSEETAPERTRIDADDFELITADDLGLEPFDLIRSVIDHPSGSDGSADAARCAADMAHAGYSDAQIMGILMNPANAVSAHIFRQADPRRAATRTLSFVRARQAAQANNGPEKSKTQAEPLATTLGSAWEGQPVPDREWAWKGFIPALTTTYLTAVGGGGKSLLGQQAATSFATGRPLLGRPMGHGSALYLTTEDDLDELHRRQLSINQAYPATDGGPVAWDELRGLHLCSLAGEVNNELVTFDQAGRMHLTPRWVGLALTIQELGIRFLVLDNVAHLFSGNENIRNQVAAFNSALNKLAQDNRCSILLLGHPNKAGEEFSGSTAWENQFRSRLFFGPPVTPDGQVASDPDLRALRRSKSNYAQRGGTIEFRWLRGAFWQVDAIPEDELDTGFARGAEVGFLACLDEMTRQRRSVSSTPTRANFAPKEFARMREAQGMRKEALREAMDRLFRDGVIENGELDWPREGSRHPALGLKRTGKAHDDDPF